MALNKKSIKENEMEMYNEKYIPPHLLRPGQSIWRFHQYFSQLQPKRKPQTTFSFDSNGWLYKVIVFEPKQVEFTGKSNKKKEAEGIAMAKTLLFLRDNNFLDHAFNPIFSTYVQRKEFLDKMYSPISIDPIEQKSRNSLKNFINRFNSVKPDLLQTITSFNKKQFNNVIEESEELDLDESEEFIAEEINVMRNVLTGQEFREANNEELSERDETLLQHLEKRKVREEISRLRNTSFAKIRKNASELPIAQYRDDIIETIQGNRVVVISGDTGCGKTTQIPQYIFENEITNKRGAFANIVVTQPRRISAISIADRVAQEFGEEIGQSVGYQVRFDKKLPNHSNGGMLFCTAGILLRKLANNPKLKGVSHVIIDEVHERDVIIDFLLVILKRALRLNPDIHIVLMSASLNAQLFSDYFNSCPLIQIPGRCFEVEELYLDEFMNKTKVRGSFSFSPQNPKINTNLILELIDYINRSKGDGAILCFLPGWAEIQEVDRNLKFLSSSDNLMVIPVHSKLPYEDQKKIFAQPPVGVRKVILATNIAETSLTIDDVVYVIDPGLAKEIRYNSSLNVSAFGSHWISRANAKQRSGRAGRVKPGQCYRLYTKEIENAFMDPFPTPELLRVPLESVVMHSKLHFPAEKVESILSEVPQSPTPDAITKAIATLKQIDVMDNNQNLTILGKRIVSFTTHPRLSVSLIYSSMFGCLKSMLYLVSSLSAYREPFQVMPDQKQIIRETKREFQFGDPSDHLSLINIMSDYDSIKNTVEKVVFRDKYNLSRFGLDAILETNRLFASHLENSKFITKQSWNETKNDINHNWHHKDLILACLIPGFTQNFIRIIKGEVKDTKILSNKVSFVDINSGKKVRFVSESSFGGNIDAKALQSNSLIIYFGSYFSQEAKMLSIRDGSFISPLILLLFNGNNYEIDSQNINPINGDNARCSVILRNNDYLKLEIDKNDLKLIEEWAEILKLFTEWYVMPYNSIKASHEIRDLLREFIQLTYDELV